MKYNNIILSARWFGEGWFWALGADGYKSENDDDPDQIEVDPNSLGSDLSEIEVVEELELIAEHVLAKDAIFVSIHLNGSEIDTIFETTEKYLEFVDNNYVPCLTEAVETELFQKFGIEENVPYEFLAAQMLVMAKDFEQNGGGEPIYIRKIRKVAFEILKREHPLNKCLTN